MPLESWDKTEQETLGIVQNFDFQNLTFCHHSKKTLQMQYDLAAEVAVRWASGHFFRRGEIIEIREIKVRGEIRKW